MKTADAPNINALRQLIQSHLKSFGIQSHIQEALSQETESAESAGRAGEKAPDDVISLLRKKGVIQEFIKSLKEQTEIESLVLSSADPESEGDGDGSWTNNEGSHQQPSRNQSGDLQHDTDVSSEEFAKTERWLQQQESWGMGSRLFSGWNDHGGRLLSSDTGPKPVELLSVQIPKISTAAGLRNTKVHPSVKLENPRHQNSRIGPRSSKLAEIEAALRPDKSYLFVRIHGGREFLKRHGDAAEDCLLVSVSFWGQRILSKSLAGGTEPVFSDTLVLELTRGATTGGEYRKAEEELLSVIQPIHIVLVRVKPSGEKALIGTAMVEWRRSLFFGVESLSVELLGIGSKSSVVTGILDLDLELRPSTSQLPISQAVIAAQLQKEQAQNSACISAFITYAKTWWKEFLRMRQCHPQPHSNTDSQRLVKVLALNESRQARPVCSYVQPLQAGRLLGSSAEAARFVSLLNHEEDKVQGCETWTNMHTFLTRGSGDQEDHAVLLCNLLLGFGLDAFVCIGRDSQGARLWVMTRASGGDVIFWESLTGQRYAFKTWAANANPPVPYQFLSCVFNHQRFYANIQPSDAVRNCFLDLENEQHWKCMPADKLSPIPKAPGVVFRPPSMQAFAHEEKLEGIVRAMITDYRQKLRMPSSWSKKLSRLLMPALVAYEQEAIFGGPLRHEEFQQGITRAIPKRHVFKGIPLHFNHLSPKKLIAQLCGDPEFQHLLEMRGQLVNFAVRVKITVYPEDVCSCWVMVAVEYPCAS